MAEFDADYIIVGSGSAGSVLANRLSACGTQSVLVLEQGGTDIGPFIQMPAALSYPMNMSRYDWGFETLPEPALGGRKLACPRGKVIGGSSSINGMVYVRGNPADFDYWQQSGASGWSYADVLPYYLKMESSHGGQAGWRGTDGPLHVTRGPRDNPLFHAFVQAGIEAGYEATDDYNGEKQEGFGPMEQTVWRGRRWSTANAYLRTALKRSKVRLQRGFVRKVVFEGRKAVGVEIETAGRVSVLRAGREVILSASSINSPKLLMLSGIGDEHQLRKHGIDVVQHSPGVGKNLQDHLELYFQVKCKQPITLYSKLNLFSKAAIGAQWLFFKSGLGASNQFESAAFIRSDVGVEYPDIQYHFLPVAIRYDGKSAAKSHGFQMHTGPMRSDSRGEVTLRSSDPLDPPDILFNYMSTEKDWSDFRKCIRLTRELLQQKAFEPFAGAEIAPGEHCQSDEEIDTFVREHVESAYHPCGTCRMGDPDDAAAVVDSDCRVLGVGNLRVVDCSVFPRITNGNLNAPTIVVAEKASDAILGKAPLPASDKTPWRSRNWQSSQR
ncbi:choline dehydrogenase [Chromatiales bacterium (ex Bugula neritina AB1)]|nr:choline dehydrogenase [Chromatiales bacterium (ex Bugula neritina AB1)]